MDHKVLRQFPLIPCLQRMYNTLAQAKLMVWHWHNCSKDGLVQHAPYSHQWKFINNRWLVFAQEAINVRLGLATDGVNPFNGQTHFNMCAMLMWTMHNLSTYGIVARCVTKGYRGCPCCGANTITRRSQVLQKNVYCSQHKKWLPMEHVYWHNTFSFDGVQEHGMAPQ